MKNLLMVFMLLNSGCAVLDQVNRQTQERNATRNAELLKKQEAEEERERLREVARKEADKKMDEALNPGTNIKVFMDAYGKPQDIGYDNKKDVLYYDLTPEKSYKFYFEKKSLVGWAPNYERDQQRQALKYQSNLEQLELQRKREQVEAANQQAWQSLGNMANQWNTDAKIKNLEQNQRQIETARQAPKNNSERVLVNQPGR